MAPKKSVSNTWLRREKSITGMREMLLRGEWCTSPPIGYDIVHREGSRDIVVNVKGKLLKKAFYWKAKEKLSSEEIRRKLAGSGMKISSQKMSEVLRNPFYCGLMVHNLLNGQIVAGRHEKLISEELFLEVNGIMAQNTQGYSTHPENEHIPLKRFLKCEQCGQYLRAYKAWKNQQYYYKCNTPGCKCNKRADELHTRFRNILASYTMLLDEDTAWAAKEAMMDTYRQLNQDSAKERESLGKALSEITAKLDRLEERYVLEEITREMHDKYNFKYKAEKQDLERQLTNCGDEVSNLEECLDSIIDFGSKLAAVWDLSDYKGRQELQFLLFPEGIFYDRKNEGCRTGRVNEVFSAIAGPERASGENKDGNNQHLLIVPAYVPPSGMLSNQMIGILKNLVDFRTP